ncbi:MAG: hypothetical protein H0T46_18140 [Deltaproteobacteria bacterium]|nr:hypothetical protein [Deltaproteobacteria bacterium]
MNRQIARLVMVATLLVGGGLWVSACKQDEGDRCQTSTDCDDPLVCNQATQTCAKMIGGGIDAMVPPQPEPDAAMIDAAVDAPVDMMIDAMIDAP